VNDSGGKYLIFGATGMVGQGIVRECLADLPVWRGHRP
jgi:uncharacterized protein YbjT (DUF2867 family)